MKQIVGIMTRTVLLVVWGMMAVACERGDGLDSADPLVAVAVHTRAGETDGDRLSPTLQQGIVFAYNADGILEGCATFDATSTMVAFKLREGKKTFVVVGNPREELKKKLVRQVGAASEETPGTIAETGDETVTSWTSPYRYEKLKGVVVGSDDLDYIRTSGQVLLWGETCTDVRQSTSASDTPIKVEVKTSAVVSRLELYVQCVAPLLTKDVVITGVKLVDVQTSVLLNGNKNAEAKKGNLACSTPDNSAVFSGGDEPHYNGEGIDLSKHSAVCTAYSYPSKNMYVEMNVKLKGNVGAETYKLYVRNQEDDDSEMRAGHLYRMLVTFVLDEKGKLTVAEWQNVNNDFVIGG
ncbi:hypothetical protein [uncultured Bacteroides sp.]|uniref:hypothetical protein n=1 Tax=uncultured Bacteroides sp. TaxID=162156 RepID=UPI0025A990D6|nr:hypothetical protein [uncultured Bacteroides sp.]